MLIGHSVADEAGKLLAVDPQVCEIMQREKRELVGVTYESITHPDDRARNIDLIVRLATGDGPVTIRKRYVRSDGSVAWANVQASRLSANGHTRLVGTIELLNSQLLARNPEHLWRSARGVLEFMEHRRKELGDQLFSDFVWMILVHVYLAEIEGRAADIKNICDRARIVEPLTTRWIRVLEQQGLVERSNRNESVPQLTTKGMAIVEKLLGFSVQN